MRKPIIATVLVGWLLPSASVLTAAESGVVWPTEWTTFGPYMSQAATHNPCGLPMKKDLLPGDALKSIPPSL